MKRSISWFLVLCLCLGAISTTAQTSSEPESLGLPGDNLNLYAVLKVFQESETLEAFEKKINDPDANINNLDLDGDDNIDYITVSDEVDGTVHNIILRVAVNSNESQDVAVITVERNSKNEVQIQLTGDEELYGKDYIIEPNFDSDDNGGTPNPGYTGNTVKFDGEPVVVNTTTTVVIASWPIVQYVYAPSYVYWHSPWHWGYYPPWWRPWRPIFWHQYYGYHYNWYHYYYGHYRPCHFHRYNRWNDFYYHGRRSRSVVVVNHRQNGYYKKTYSRPETRQQGNALYNKKYPDNPGGRPSRPATKPTNPSVTRPAKPGVTKPTNPGVTRPSKPATKPTQPTRPAPKPTPKPNPSTKPAPRPTPKPTPPPQTSKPALKPAPKPAPKPATRPAPKPTVKQ